MIAKMVLADKPTNKSESVTFTIGYGCRSADRTHTLIEEQTVIIVEECIFVKSIITND